MGRGELEAQVDAYDRAAIGAPPSVEAELKTAGRQHKAQKQRAEAAREAGDTAAAGSADILAEMNAAELARLRVADAARAEWAEAHAGEAASARRAEEELRRRGLQGRLPATDAEAAPNEREIPAIDPSDWTRRKAEQTAQAEVGRQARAEEMARWVPVTDAEVAKYGAAGQAETGASAHPEPWAGVHEELQALSDTIDQMVEQDAERDARLAEKRQAAIDELVARQPWAEPSPEASWQPGDAQGHYEAEQDAEPEMEP